MKTLKIQTQDKNFINELKKSKRSKLSLEIAEALLEVKQMQEGKIKGLNLKDI